MIIIHISVAALPPSHWKATLEFAPSIFQELLGGRAHGRDQNAGLEISCLGWKPGSSLYRMFVVGQSLMVSVLVFPLGNEAADKIS